VLQARERSRLARLQELEKLLDNQLDNAMFGVNGNLRRLRASPGMRVDQYVSPSALGGRSSYSGMSESWYASPPSQVRLSASGSLPEFGTPFASETLKAHSENVSLPATTAVARPPPATGATSVATSETSPYMPHRQLLLRERLVLLGNPRLSCCHVLGFLMASTWQVWFSQSPCS